MEVGNLIPLGTINFSPQMWLAQLASPVISGMIITGGMFIWGVMKPAGEDGGAKEAWGLFAGSFPERLYPGSIMFSHELSLIDKPFRF